MNLIPRSALIATPMALALTLAVTVGSSAQVASLVSPDETPAPSAETESAVEFEDREEALLAYAQCMRDNGIDMDDPQAGTGGGRGFLRLGGGPGGQRAVDQFGEDFQIAQQACADILEAARPEVDPEAAQEQLESQLLLAQCIRDQGYPQYPDPMIGTDGRLERVGRGTFEELGIDRRSEEFGEVLATCREEVGLEQLGPGGGPGPGRGGD